MSREISLKSYAARRLLKFIPFILIIILVNFMIIHLAPGDPVDVMIGEQAVSPGYREMLREKMGFDRPLYEQFIRYIKNILSGDLGYSLGYHQPVLTIILERVPLTLLLMGSSFVYAIILGVVLGVYTSKRPYHLTDNIISITSLIGYSVPNFWLGMMFLLLFSLNLRWFPAQGTRILDINLTGWASFLDLVRHMVLPALTLGTGYLARYTRFTRASMLEILRKDFIVTARGKGLAERTVLYRHALRNALIPVVTMVGLDFGFMFTGSVITETVFAWPGLGRLMYDSISLRDYPLLMGIFIMVSIMVMLATLATDILYAFLDPRIRYR